MARRRGTVPFRGGPPPVSPADADPRRRRVAHGAQAPRRRRAREPDRRLRKQRSLDRTLASVAWSMARVTTLDETLLRLPSLVAGLVLIALVPALLARFVGRGTAIVHGVAPRRVAAPLLLQPPRPPLRRHDALGAGRRPGVAPLVSDRQPARRDDLGRDDHPGAALPPAGAARGARTLRAPDRRARPAAPRERPVAAAARAPDPRDARRARPRAGGPDAAQRRDGRGASSRPIVRDRRRSRSCSSSSPARATRLGVAVVAVARDGRGGRARRAAISSSSVSSRW